ncbi:MAG: hypothetical protein VR70_06475 [Rhodospirillaceae bacterium BRH_c57]|nr:MAG: hypothetical protein VR70_06475 [Rhodospirillaceae bacterium BRH_c57]
MGAVADLAALATPAPSTREDMLSRVKALAETDIKDMAPTVDRDGVYPADTLRKLGQAGAFSQHLSGHGYSPDRRLLDTIEAMAVAGEHCGCTSFLMWLQNAFGWYLEVSDNTALRDMLQARVAQGALFGTSGMSNPVKSMDGIEKFKLRGRRVKGGYEVSGSLPYVSNLGDGHYMGSAFELADQPDHKVMAVFHINGDDVKIAQNTHFIALEGSGTYAVLVKKHFVSDDMVLADPIPPYVKRIKPAFFLMQAGIALGQIQAHINIMRDADKTLGHVNQYLPDRPEFFEDEMAKATELVAELVKTPLDPDPGYLRKVYEARLAAGELTMRAANSALMHAGARGYITGAAADRRFRESVFVAIVTPATKHLRKAIADLDAA